MHKHIYVIRLSWNQQYPLLAQWLEQRPVKSCVTGSIPVQGACCRSLTIVTLQNVPDFESSVRVTFRILTNFDLDWLALVIPVTGIPVSLVWYWIIKSHADLNRVKFKVIHELEIRLPAAVYKHEWDLAEGGRGKAYRSVTRIERWMPWLFGVLHVVLAVVIVFENVGVVDLAG